MLMMRTLESLITDSGIEKGKLARALFLGAGALTVYASHDTPALLMFGIELSLPHWKAFA